jgi:hypothetical protein
MTSKITRSVASRIPVDLYDQLMKECDELELCMKDYLLRIILERNAKKNQPAPKAEKIKPVKKEKVVVEKKPKKKPEKPSGLTEIIFPD